MQFSKFPVWKIFFPLSCSRRSSQKKKELIGGISRLLFFFFIIFYGELTSIEDANFTKSGSIKIGIYNRPSCMLIGTWIRKKTFVKSKQHLKDRHSWSPQKIKSCAHKDFPPVSEARNLFSKFHILSAKKPEGKLGSFCFSLTI